VAVVDAGDNGLFVDIIYAEDGSPLKVGDKLYLAAPSAAQVPATPAGHEATRLLREVLTTLDMWADVAPAVSLRADISKYLATAPSAAAPAAPEQVQWISVDERLPECSKKPGSLGVEVIVYPKPEKGESTAFFGCRLTDEPDFYKYGSRVGGITHWMPLPAAPSMKTATNEGKQT
jgi:hypothetical protein